MSGMQEELNPLKGHSIHVTRENLYYSMFKFFGTILYNNRHSGRSEAETRARSEAFQRCPGTL
ncbi:MAG: hypothetical protein R6U13_15015 [Desulfatiglandaceae bacterium]